MDGAQGEGREGGPVNVTIHDIDQRSDAWIRERIGRYCGSQAKLVWSGWDVKEGRKKGSESIQRRDLRLDIVCQRMTGESQEDTFTPPDYMQRGIDKEQAAFDAYELGAGRAVRRVGFVSRDDLMVGCSPDGLIGNIEGGCEMKCPKSATHLGYIRDSKANGPLWFPEEHIPQMRHNLFVTGAQWWDFVSFDDRLPPSLRLFVKRLLREQAGMEQYEKETRAFLKEIDDEILALQALAAAVA